jgi:hypothetical protein
VNAKSGTYRSTFTILNDDAPPEVSISDAVVTQAGAGTVTANLTLSLSAPTGEYIRVFYGTMDGTASAGTDYLPVSSNHLFQPDESSSTAVGVTVLSGPIEEPIESFSLDITSAEAPIADGQGLVTILPGPARSFVSRAGNDGNSCTVVTAPCRTLAGGMSRVRTKGEVIVLDSGSFGALSIDRAVTIDAPAGVVALTATTVTVAAPPTGEVVLRGLTITALNQGSGAGVQFISGAALFVENCVIDGWDRGIDFAADGQLFVADTTVRNSSSTGLRIAPATLATAVLDRSRFEGTAGGCGVEVLGNAVAALRGGSASGNAKGLCASAGADLSVGRALISTTS